MGHVAPPPADDFTADGAEALLTCFEQQVAAALRDKMAVAVLSRMDCLLAAIEMQANGIHVDANVADSAALQQRRSETVSAVQAILPAELKHAVTEQFSWHAVASVRALLIGSAGVLEASAVPKNAQLAVTLGALSTAATGQRHFKRSPTLLSSYLTAAADVDVAVSRQWETAAQVTHQPAWANSALSRCTVVFAATARGKTTLLRFPPCHDGPAVANQVTFAAGCAADARPFFEGAPDGDFVVIGNDVAAVASVLCPAVLEHCRALFVDTGAASHILAALAPELTVAASAHQLGSVGPSVKSAAELQHHLLRYVRQLRADGHAYCGIGLSARDVLLAALGSAVAVAGADPFLTRRAAAAAGHASTRPALEHPLLGTVERLFNSADSMMPKGLSKVLTDAGHPLGALIEKSNSIGRLEAEMLGVTRYVSGATGHIHANIIPWGTTTGRMSAQSPNIFGVATDAAVRSNYTTRFPGGCLVDVDFSQLEVTVLCVLSGDHAMADDIRNRVDFHCKRVTVLADMPYDDVVRRVKVEFDPAIIALRKVAKTLSFQHQYGAGAALIAERTGLSLEAVQKFKSAERRAFPQNSAFQEWTRRTLQKELRANVPTVTFRLPSGVAIGVPVRDGKLHRPSYMNYPVQAFAAEIVQMTVGAVWRHFAACGNYDGRALLINSVHDCVWIDCASPEIAQEVVSDVTRLMRAVPQLVAERWPGVPCDVPFNGAAEVGPALSKMSPLAQNAE
jgi:hypothetical protein